MFQDVEIAQAMAVDRSRPENRRRVLGAQEEFHKDSVRREANRQLLKIFKRCFDTGDESSFLSALRLFGIKDGSAEFERAREMWREMCQASVLKSGA